MIEETDKSSPERQCVMCSLTCGTLRQGALLRSQDLRPDVIEQGRHPLEAQRMTRSVIHVFCASFGIDGEQIIHPGHDAHCGLILWVQLHRIDELSPRVCPAHGMDHLRAADLIVSGLAIGLKDSIELFYELLRTSASTPEPSGLQLLVSGRRPPTAPPSPHRLQAPFSRLLTSPKSLAGSTAGCSLSP